jgi:hypothetical protein
LSMYMRNRRPIFAGLPPQTEKYSIYGRVVIKPVVEILINSAGQRDVIYSFSHGII